MRSWRLRLCVSAGVVGSVYASVLLMGVNLSEGEH
jgi:hypothetical protein